MRVVGVISPRGRLRRTPSPLRESEYRKLRTTFNTMSEDERTSWNRRYREKSHLSLAPDPFLVQTYDEFIHPLFPRGREALDVAGGVGRHALFLAQRGWRVTLNDISEVGIDQAKAAADKRGLRGIEYVVCDTSEFNFGRARYDLVFVFFYLERSLFPKLRKALRPGGLLVYKTYTHEHRKYGRGPAHPMYFLKDNELLHAFGDMRVLFYRETVKERGVAELVARR